MLHLLTSDDNILRELSVNIIPKIAQADWPNEWPGFLEELSKVIQESSTADTTAYILCVLKVLRGIPLKFS